VTLTELFFERPRELEKAEPEVYAELRRFYGQDPARRWEWWRMGVGSPGFDV